MLCCAVLYCSTLNDAALRYTLSRKPAPARVGLCLPKRQVFNDDVEASAPWTSLQWGKALVGGCLLLLGAVDASSRLLSRNAAVRWAKQCFAPGLWEKAEKVVKVSPRTRTSLYFIFFISCTHSLPGELRAVLRGAGGRRWRRRWWWWWAGYRDGGGAARGRRRLRGGPARLHTLRLSPVSSSAEASVL